MTIKYGAENMQFARQITKAAHTRNASYLLLSHGVSVYAKVPHCYLYT